MHLSESACRPVALSRQCVVDRIPLRLSFSVVLFAACNNNNNWSRCVEPLLVNQHGQHGCVVTVPPLCPYHVVAVVFVKKLNGKTIALHLLAGFGVVTVGDIKRMLAAHPDGFPASRQCLIFLGVELADDSCTLDQCGVVAERTLHLVERACKPRLKVEDEEWVEVSKQQAQEERLGCGASTTIAASTAAVSEQERDGEERVFNIVVVGATGSGKSALCGAIAALLGGDASAFPSSDGASAHTMKPNAGCFSCPHMGNHECSWEIVMQGVCAT